MSNPRIDELRQEILNWYAFYGDAFPDEGVPVLEEFEALVELEALQRIVGLKVSPVE